MGPRSCLGGRCRTGLRALDGGRGLHRCEVYGHAKQGEAYGHTRMLGYHPLLATRADTGEVLHARMRSGRANTARGAKRFVEELAGRLRRAGAGGR
jgi:hypothetical protein